MVNSGYSSVICETSSGNREIVRFPGWSTYNLSHTRLFVAIISLELKTAFLFYLEEFVTKLPFFHAL